MPRASGSATSRYGRENYAWLLTGPLIVLTIIMFTPAVLSQRPILAPLPAIALYFVIFLTAEAVSVTLEIRGHGTVLTLTEIPLVVALFYLPPLPLLAMRFVAPLRSRTAVATSRSRLSVDPV